METSAPKRRRTSPRTSVAVDPNNDNNNNHNETARRRDRATTPEHENEPAIIPRNPGASPSRSPRRKRPDFASPTKASLARHNPEILARRRSEQQQRRASEQQARQFQGGQAEADTAPEDLPASRPGSSRGSDVSLSELLTAQVVDTGMGGKPRRSPIKHAPITRPLPPPAPEGEELVDPFTRRDRIRRSNQGQVEDEPELPPTPSQLGIRDDVVTTPPVGIHSESSPLRRRQARRTLGSSPLKKGRAADIVVRPRSPVDLLANPQEIPREAGAGAHPARGVRADAEIREKEDYLAALKQEEESLWSDLRLIAGLGRQWAVNGEAAQVLPLVKKHPKLLPQPEPDAADAAADGDFKALLQGVMDPSSWLPLSNPTATTSPAEAAKDDDALLPTPISHHPVQMTASEELPFLQMFTPFTLTTSGAPLSEDDMDNYTRHHTISLRATDFPALFSSQISLAVDLSDFSVSDLRVLRLDPNAEAELAPFVDDLLTRTDRAMSRNVALVCWAMGEWYRVAVKRAAFWHGLYGEVGGAGELAVENAGQLWRRRGVVVTREAGAEGEGDEALVGVKEGTAGDLLPYMGTVAATVPLGFCGDGVMVRIGWKISFDWTGDAQSKVDVAVGVPGHWHKGDPKGVLAGIPKIFDDIVRGTSDVQAAVRRVVALLADRG
ncbi:uncharacterized protein DNG_10184 [Cephalotrichum gorgonifer]|uniref:Uncharacterized protein n=1 Tax=Cephalotrichum gorgonifer TaxID=2041049 RepID=A0AAE8N748_9PEZI|nr:uncharacterized protein DNG_10184 [Cephalotrichum gorgonifer]